MALTSIDVLSARHSSDHGYPSVGLISGTQIVPPGGASHERGTQATHRPSDTTMAAARTLSTRPG